MNYDKMVKEMREKHRTTVKQIADAGTEYQNVVYLHDGEYTVFQEDIEDGEVWNKTPVKSFGSMDEAKQFADAN